MSPRPAPKLHRRFVINRSLWAAVAFLLTILCLYLTMHYGREGRNALAAIAFWVGAFGGCLCYAMLCSIFSDQD